MKPETLLAIKQQVSKFSKLYDILIEMWNGKLEHGNRATYPETIQIGVILGNIAFNPINCHGYSHKEEVKKVRNLVSVLESINRYHNECYMTHYAYNEVKCIYDGETMSEDYDMLAE